MGTDGALAKVSYLPGVVPLKADAAVQDNVQVSADAQDSAELRGNAALPERALRRAENVSLNALTRKGRSRWELGQILLARELDKSVVEAELDRLERVGLLDDGALARDFVRTQHERKGLGRQAIISELRRKSIDSSVIDAALEQLGADDELTRARQLATKRSSHLMGLDHDTAVRRLSGYLQRKGYSSDTVRAAVLEAIPRQNSGVRFT